jgi:N-acetylglutamate synthase-like GNAT family acetyltransferase
MKDIVQEISFVTKHEKNLMFRSEREIKHAVLHDELITIFEGEELIGFVVVKSLQKDIVEIGCLYVFPQFRGQGKGKELMQKALKKAAGKTILIRTKEKKLKELFESWGLKKVSLKRNWYVAYIYLKDRLLHPIKFSTFLKSVNGGSCVFFGLNNQYFS